MRAAKEQSRYCSHTLMDAACFLTRLPAIFLKNVHWGNSDMTVWEGTNPLQRPRDITKQWVERW